MFNFDLCDQRWVRRYFWLITNFKDLESLYKENHHIVPSAVGGANVPTNRIDLPARVHFLVHFCLWKMMPIGTQYRKDMSYAFNQMRRIKSSRLYEKHKIEHAKNVSEDKKGNQYVKGLKTCHDTNTGAIKRLKEIPEGFMPGFPESYKEKKRQQTSITNGTEEQKWNKSDPVPAGWRIGRCDSFRAKVSVTSKGNKSNLGKTYQRSEETRRKLSKAMKGKSAPNHGKSQFYDPLTGRKVWANEAPEGFERGWGTSFSESIQKGMMKNPKFKNFS